jgi:hypothetical protein
MWVEIGVIFVLAFELAPLSKAIYIALVILLPPRFIPKDLGI